MAMLDRDLRIEEIASTVFLAEHICSRNPFELHPDASTEQASLLMQLYELDQAPIASSGGSQIVLRMNLDAARSGQKVGQLAVDTPAEHWVDHNHLCTIRLNGLPSMAGYLCVPTDPYLAPLAAGILVVQQFQPIF